MNSTQTQDKSTPITNTDNGVKIRTQVDQLETLLQEWEHVKFANIFELTSTIRHNNDVITIEHFRLERLNKEGDGIETYLFPFSALNGGERRILPATRESDATLRDVLARGIVNSGYITSKSDKLNDALKKEYEALQSKAIKALREDEKHTNNGKTIEMPLFDYIVQNPLEKNSTQFLKFPTRSKKVHDLMLSSYALGESYSEVKTRLKDAGWTGKLAILDKPAQGYRRQHSQLIEDRIADNRAKELLLIVTANRLESEDKTVKQKAQIALFSSVQMPSFPCSTHYVSTADIKLDIDLEEGLELF